MYFRQIKAFYENRRSVQSKLSCEPNAQPARNINYTEKTCRRKERDKKPTHFHKMMQIWIVLTSGSSQVGEGSPGTLEDTWILCWSNSKFLGICTKVEQIWTLRQPSPCSLRRNMGKKMKTAVLGMGITRKCHHPSRTDLVS